MALTELDRNLLQRCLSGEPGAWKDFVDRFVGLFVHVINHAAHARSVQLSQEDVDDVCAEVFLALLANDAAVLRHFRGKSSLATYLAVIARRTAIREIAQRRMAEALGHVHAHQGGPGGYHVPAPDQQVETQDEIQQMIAQLPEADAEVVRQYHLEGRSYREISSKLGMPENTIGPTLTRARSKMRRGGVQS